MGTKITGGKSGFAAAVRDAFYGRGCQTHSPSLKYSHRKGFVVESALTPDDDDVIWSHRCHIAADDGAHSLTPSDYAQVRGEILGER